MGLEIVDKFLEILNISNETKGELENNKNVEQERSFQIFIKDIDNKTKVVEISRGDTIKTLWLKIKEKTPIEGKWLQFGGKPLSNDNLTIEDYNIQKNSTLQLSGRLKGGAFIPGELKKETKLQPEGNVLQIQETVLEAQESVEKRLKEKIDKWEKKDKGNALKIIEKAKDDALMYSEDSLAFYLKKGKDIYIDNTDLNSFFKEVNTIVGELNELNKKVEANRAQKETNRKTEKKQDEKKNRAQEETNTKDENEKKKTIMANVDILQEKSGAKIDELEGLEKRTEEEEKCLKIYKETLKILGKCIVTELASTSSYIENALVHLKRCPYYTLEANDLVLCKSRDLPLGEVYMEPIEGGDETPKELKSLMKSFYQKIYSDMNMLSKQIKTVGLCNTYYLTALKEQHKEGKNKGKIKNIIASLSSTTSTYSNNIPFEAYRILKEQKEEDFFGDGFIKIMEEIDSLDFNLIGNPGEYEYRDQANEADNLPNIMHKEYSYAQEVTFASIAAAARGIANIGNIIKKAQKKDESYWTNQIGNMQGIIETVCRLRNEFKNRMNFADGLLAEFKKEDRTKTLSPIIKKDLGFSNFKDKELPYMLLVKDIKLGIINKLITWTITVDGKKYEVNPSKIAEFEKDITPKITQNLQGGKYKYNLTGNVLSEIVDSGTIKTREPFIENRIDSIYNELSLQLRKAAETKEGRSIFSKLICGNVTEAYESNVTKSKQDPVKLGIEVFKGSIADTSGVYTKYIAMANENITNLRITADNITKMKNWRKGSKEDLKDMKDLPIYKNIMEEPTHTANLLEEANSYYDLSDQLRVMELESKKIKTIMDGDVETEKDIENLKKGRRWAAGITGILTECLIISAGVTAAAFPPVAPLLTLIGGGVKLVGVVIEKVLEYKQSNKEDKLNLSPFMAVINDFMKIIIDFQEGINKYTAMIFEFCRLKSALIEKAA